MSVVLYAILAALISPTAGVIAIIVFGTVGLMFLVGTNILAAR
jgi:hypothetical protein